MTKPIFVAVICSALGAPAFAGNNDPACVPTMSSTGESVYYTPAPAVSRENRELTASEKRREWLRNHTPSGKILGNMSGAAGNSALGYMHGTDEPQGHIYLRNDEGSSSVQSRWNRSTATDTSDDDL